jgi:hypothetical protein
MVAIEDGLHAQLEFLSINFTVDSLCIRSRSQTYSVSICLISFVK